MKNIKNMCFLFALILSILSCEKDFEELNTNTVDPTSESVDPVYVLNNAIIGLSFPTGTNIFYDAGVVQQIVTPNSGVVSGANYNQDNRNNTGDQWDDLYENVIKHTGDVINQVQEIPERSNLYNIARIIEAYAFLVLTDTYGDIPYFEAGQGFSNQIVLPVYDAQENIYPDLIKELNEAMGALSDSGDVVNEVMYGGDLDKWRRLGNSLLLRIGMRLSNVDNTLAQQTVQNAFSGGVMTSNEDNFVVRHDNNFTNPYGPTFNGTEANNLYLVGAFVDFLSNSNDPRLGAIAIRYVGAASGPEQILDIATKDPAQQIGMPMGHDNSSIGTEAANLGLASFYDFSQMDRYALGANDAPMFLCTYGQTQLLLAEAITNGWVTGDAAASYENGVRAHMEQLGDYGEETTVATVDIDTYLAVNPFDAGNAVEQINTQYWVASFLNGPEAFANFRRSGFPDLTPNPYPGQDITGDFINRLTYPSSEIAVNKANLDAAISRMGADDLDTKVWWDNQ
ncbi:MAG: SusD/RagB family nutrient-binding outer membrane lipoprotein [Flavobacteriaceae bacterium]|nr:MAG: SusD/RagB family nutrient-binding outer membrane lipoprotein [Flavobacteriaceae bacterium]